MARSLRAIKRAGGTFKAIGVLAVILSVLTVCVFAGAEAALANTDGAFDPVADTSTAEIYQTILGTTDESGNAVNSTRYAGRVWTDKSVTTGNSATFTGKNENGAGEQEFSFQKSDQGDFLITYSALATSQEITELPKVPVDVVFVLDFSGSMCWDTQMATINPDYQDDPTAARENSRIKAMVDALNKSIDTLVKDNDLNRIAIVAFANKSSVMLELTSAADIKQNMGASTEYLTLNDFTDIKYNKGSNLWDATTSVTCRMGQHENTISTSGGTNIQAGLHTGMSILVNESSTTFVYEEEEYTRIPNVVLMSDGAPTTFSSAVNSQYYVEGERSPQTGPINRDIVIDTNQPVESGSWWADNLVTDREIGNGNTAVADSADGFMAMLTAAYKKNEIQNHYSDNAVGTPNAEQANCSVYTIGFSTEYQTDEMTALVNTVLNPADNLGIESQFDAVGELNEAWEIYKTGYGEVKVHGQIGKNSSSGDYEYIVERARDENNPESLVYPDAYFAADDADSLNDAFTQITNAITDSAKVPTEVTGGGVPLQDGYITYTDTIGKYMKLTGINGLLYGSTQFDKVTEVRNNDGSVTYQFATQSGETSVSSPLYSDRDVNNIVVTASTDDSGVQTLTVKIPAALIPLRISYIDVKADGNVVNNETNNVYPLRLVYEVGVADGVLDDEGKVIEGTGQYDADNEAFDGVDADYISANSDASGSLRLYSNLYTKKTQEEGNEISTVGDATVTFTPANDNPFYFIQENTPLYTSMNGERAMSFDPNSSYWFQVSYYEGTGPDAEKTIWIERSGSLLNGYVENDESGLYITEGAPRLGNLTDVVDAVMEGYVNSTGTAEHPYFPTFEGNPHDSDSQFKVYLGNNGRLSVSLPGPDVLPALQVTKKDADDESKTLGGAGFVLYVDSNDAGTPGEFDENDTPMDPASGGAAEVTDGQNGIALFAPDKYTFVLGTTYFLVETQAPSGYQLMDGAVKIVFSENDGSDENYPVDTYPFKAAIKFPGENEATVYCEELTAPGEGTKYQVATISVTVSDNALPNLPATGSNGRTALAATGVAAVTLGAYALWSRRRAFDQ